MHFKAFSTYQKRPKHPENYVWKVHLTRYAFASLSLRRRISEMKMCALWFSFGNFWKGSRGERSPGTDRPSSLLPLLATFRPSLSRHPAVRNPNRPSGGLPTDIRTVCGPRLRTAQILHFSLGARDSPWTKRRNTRRKNNKLSEASPRREYTRKKAASYWIRGQNGAHGPDSQMTFGLDLWIL